MRLLPKHHQPNEDTIDSLPMFSQRKDKYVCIISSLEKLEKTLLNTATIAAKTDDDEVRHVHMISSLYPTAHNLL